MSSSQAVKDCIIYRIRTQHIDLLVEYGSRLLDAIDEKAAYLYDFEEIGSSDISCWVNEIQESLAHGK